MPKLVYSKQPEYYDPPEIWLVEPTSSSASAINQELEKIPSSAPAGSLAEILVNTGLSVKMKNSNGQWIDI